MGRLFFYDFHDFRGHNFYDFQPRDFCNFSCKKVHDFYDFCRISCKV